METGIIVAIASAVSALGGGALSHFSKRRQNDSSDLDTLRQTVDVLTNQQKEMLHYILNMQREKSAQDKLIDDLQDQVRKLKTALDKRDAEISTLKHAMSKCPMFSGNGECERSRQARESGG